MSSTKVKIKVTLTGVRFDLGSEKGYLQIVVMKQMNKAGMFCYIRLPDLIKPGFLCAMFKRLLLP